jgi:3D (Asp-Asp-Asp) domain-containing protein
MRSSFSKTVGIACITTLFQLGFQTQNPAIPQIQSTQPSESSGKTSPTESHDISKPGKPKSDDQAFLVSENASEKSYAALVFRLLMPRLALIPEKDSEKSVDKASSEAGTDVRARSWTIPSLATGSAGEAGARSRIRPAIAEPKISPNNPSIRFRVNPSESKMIARPFDSPSMELLGPLKSFQATAYALRGQTASGDYVRRGVIAADPRVIPLGSVVQISTPGYSGIYTVQDTGRLIKGDIVDLWMGSYREARVFGRRQIKLQVLKWGNNRRGRNR